MSIFKMSNTYMNKSSYMRQRTQLEAGGNGDVKGAMCTCMMGTGMTGQRLMRCMNYTRKRDSVRK